MTVAPNNGRVNKQAVIDLVVALVAVPLLVVFGLMLESNMRGEDWALDAEARWHVLGLGLALLFISLLVMGYVTHRLGICIWQASQTDEVLSASRRGHRQNGTRTSTDSQLQLVVSGELPPSYESVVSFDMPPPYCSILVFDEKNSTESPARHCKQCAATAQQPKQAQTSAEHQPKQPEQQAKQTSAEHQPKPEQQAKQTATEQSKQSEQKQAKCAEDPKCSGETDSISAPEQQSTQTQTSEQRSQTPAPSSPKEATG